MNRRDFLRRSLFGVAAWPVLVQSSFAGDPGMTDLARDLNTAKLNQRDLLVFIIPHDDDRWDRGHALGAFLNHGSDGVRARLSTVELSCATLETVQTLTRATLPANTAMVLVRLAEVPAEVSHQALELPPLNLWGGMLEDETWQEREAREAEMIRDRISEVERAVQALLPSPVADPKTALADVLERIVLAPPTGAKWAKSTGCGTSIEGEEMNRGYACGMGHVPELTQRFLLFPSDA